MSTETDVARLNHLMDRVVARYGTSTEAVMDGEDMNDVDRLWFCAHDAIDEIVRLRAANDELRGSTIGVARATKALLSTIEDRMKDSDIMRRIDSRSPIGDAWLDARDALARFERDTPIRMGGESAATTEEPTSSVCETCGGVVERGRWDPAYPEIDCADCMDTGLAAACRPDEGAST